MEQLHLAQLELIKLQLQIATYTIATQKKPETTEKAVQCDSSLDIQMTVDYCRISIFFYYIIFQIIFLKPVVYLEYFFTT